MTSQCSSLTCRRNQGRLRTAALIFAMFLAAQPLFSAQTLADADWFSRPLADGVIWKHYLFDDLFGGKQSVSYLEIDLNNPNVSVEFPYLAASRQKTSSMTPAQFPTAKAAVNGTYFDVDASGGHRTYLRINSAEIPPGGALFSAWGYEAAIAMDASGAVSIQQKPSGGWANDTTHPDIMACGPNLIVNDVIPSSHFTDIGSHCTSRHPRSAVGVTATNKLILLAVDGRTDLANGMSCEELAQTLDQLGCVNAFNLDGGGSTTLWGAGEPNSGVLNYPSDNGLYDHLGERSCSNAIAIVAPTTGTLAWDGRVTGKTFAGSMNAEATQSVTLTFKNLGSNTWTAANTKLVLARPTSRISALQDASWPSASQPAVMSPASVATGGTATFTFTLKAPAVTTTTVYDEHFRLEQAGVGRIGPADSECWMRIIAEPPATGGASFLVESRTGGQNFAWYSDSGMADTSTNCTATGATGTIGMRYGSTYRSVAGAKNATAAPNFPGAGYYNVYVAWGAGGSRRNPVTYRITHASGTNTYQLDQSLLANTWMRLGAAPFYFNVGYGGSVAMTNEDIDMSGSMYFGAAKFEFVAPAEVNEWALYY